MILFNIVRKVRNIIDINEGYFKNESRGTLVPHKLSYCLSLTSSFYFGKSLRNSKLEATFIVVFCHMHLVK